MDRFAISATLEARPGKEGEVEEFLKSAQPLVMQEAGTTTWFAFRIGPATFGIFDTFANEAGLQAHLNGAIAKAIFAKAEELFAKPPQIQQIEIFAASRFPRSFGGQVPNRAGCQNRGLQSTNPVSGAHRESDSRGR